jgi:hypothetical protein
LLVSTHSITNVFFSELIFASELFIVIFTIVSSQNFPFTSIEALSIFASSSILSKINTLELFDINVDPVADFSFSSSFSGLFKYLSQLFKIYQSSFLNRSSISIFNDFMSKSPLLASKREIDIFSQGSNKTF